MRSTTLIIRNDARRPIGFLCINFDLGTPLIAFLDAMMKIPGAEGSPARPIAVGMCQAGGETFVQNVDELLTSAVARIQQQVYADAAVPARSRTRAIVEALDQEGVFKLRNAVPRIAAALSISSDAVYMHLRALKRRRAAEG